MQPRLLFRTHYQVDEPALVEFLVKRCTSPVRSAYDENVAQKLAHEIRGLQKAFNDPEKKSFNLPAAGYALDLGHGLGVINQQNVWSERGHLVNLIAEVADGPWDKETELTLGEKLLHFRIFMEADGAALLYVAKHLLKHQTMPNSDDDWNKLATQLFVHIYSEYLTMAGTTADRVSLRREVDRIRTKGYTGKSGPHKMFIHLQTLCRLGLVDRSASSASRRYSLAQGRMANGLQTLVKEVPNLHDLERAIKERRLLDLAARVFAPAAGGTRRGDWTVDHVMELLVPTYQRVMETGVSLCSLATLIEAVQITLLAENSEQLPYGMIVQLLQRVQKERPGDVRFHVDRQGAPAFLKLADKVVSEYVPHGA